ncbi:hypothetical protein V5O48_013676 [Marasmius crinis-equi]|uniref:Uncharacterized protein n=1 Tax=Marasmius crinis-equi TaxID=585013 RepID=A0ABR3EZE5_9AGAR
MAEPGGACIHKCCTCSTFVLDPVTGRCATCDHNREKHPVTHIDPPRTASIKSEISAVRATLVRRNGGNDLPAGKTKFTLCNEEANRGLAGNSTASPSAPTTRKSSKGGKGKGKLSTAVENVKIAGIVLNAKGTNENDVGVVKLNDPSVPSAQTLQLLHELGLAVYEPNGVQLDKNMTSDEVDSYLRDQLPVLNVADEKTGRKPDWAPCNPPQTRKPAMSFASECGGSTDAKTLYDKRLGARRPAEENIIVIATVEPLDVDNIYNASGLDHSVFVKKWNQLLHRRGIPDGDSAYLVLPQGSDADESPAEDVEDRKKQPPVKHSKALAGQAKPAASLKRKRAEEDSVEEFSDSDSSISDSIQAWGTSKTSKLRVKQPTDTDQTFFNPAKPPAINISSDDSDSDDQPTARPRINYWDTDRISDFKLWD